MGHPESHMPPMSYDKVYPESHMPLMSYDESHPESHHTMPPMSYDELHANLNAQKQSSTGSTSKCLSDHEEECVGKPWAPCVPVGSQHECEVYKCPPDQVECVGKPWAPCVAVE